MADESFQERSEQATPKRRQEAKDKGQVARSRELSTMAVLMVSGVAFLLVGEHLSLGIQNIMSDNFTLQKEDIFNQNHLVNALVDTFQQALLALLPFLLIVMTVAILSPMAVGGWVYSVQSIMFKWEKIDPVRGIKKIFSARSLMELLKALFKFLIVLSVSISLIWFNMDYIYLIGKTDPVSSIHNLSKILIWAFLLISSAMVIIALIDVPFQLWDYNKNLKMTRQEVKEELKQTDGHPELKRYLKERQREISRRRMMQEVPRADVVITNPTHYAVALKYDQDKMSAPEVVAKGKDLVAFQIRNVAQANNVPILSAPPLSRALYFSTDLGQKIPDGLFLAVAQVLAFIYQIRKKKHKHDNEYSMENLPIPTEYIRNS